VDKRNRLVERSDEMRYAKYLILKLAMMKQNAVINPRMPMLKRFLGLLLLTLSGYMVAAQRDIEPRLVFSDTSRFNFTGEWQYLSTDIFLLNGDRFSNLINELNFPNKGNGKIRRKSKLEEERLEYLFITAKLKNVKFFGENDITYPLYNFQISRDKDNRYQTLVSDNIDHVRIIDNLPLYSAHDYIDAEISVKAITNNDRDQMLSLVATQLQNLSKIKTPTDAVMGIIGEFGSFIEANTRKKEYRFSSTIRLFEQKNFDTRVHSLKLYVLTTSNSKPIEVNTALIQNFMDTVRHGQVGRQTLKELLAYHNYPVIAVVNYKSLYRMEPIGGDEVTFASIETRKLRVENDYRQGLINAETYRQEKDFIAFLSVYANFKSYLDAYNLNYRTGNSDAVSISLFKVMQYYRQLVKTFEEMRFKYRGNNTFANIFRREYESVLGFASLYLDDDHNLKATKELVNSLVKLDTIPMLAAADMEAYIASLRFSGAFKPDLMRQTPEGQLITNHLASLEEQLYRSTYEDEVRKLNDVEASVSTRNATEKLLAMIKNTSCGLCRERAIAAINSFGQRMDEFTRKQKVAQRDSLVNSLQPWVFNTIEQLQLMKSNLQALYPLDSLPESAKYLSTKVAEAERDLGNFRDLAKVDVSQMELSLVANLVEKLKSYHQMVEENVKLVCGVRPELCDRALDVNKSQPADSLKAVDSCSI